jgi:hypothetical protein
MPNHKAITVIEALESYVEEKEERRESGVGSCIVVGLHEEKVDCMQPCPNSMHALVIKSNLKFT